MQPFHLTQALYKVLMHKYFNVTDSARALGGARTQDAVL